jgi:hypothetical protein
MRLVRFGRAMSLDGYITGPGGEYDWIVMDPLLAAKVSFGCLHRYVAKQKLNLV